MRKLSRRQFMANSLRSAATLSLAGSVSLATAGRAVAAISQRRHLINFMVYGGIDSLWSMNGVPFSQISDITRVHSPGMSPDNGAITMDSGQSFRDPTDNIFQHYLPRQPHVLWDVRHPDSFLRAHPVTPNAWIGPGLQKLTNADLASMLFIRGIAQKGGGHFLGNRFNQTGTSGSSTPCFSATIAQHLAANGVRPLHYVQIANNSDELYNQAGNLVGAAVPIQIPDFATWQQITSFSPYDLNPDHRAALSNSLKRLSAEASGARLRKATSRSIFSSFFDSYLSAFLMSQGGAANSIQFTATLNHYRQFLKDPVLGVLGSQANHPFRSWFRNTLLSADMTLNSTMQYQFESLAFQFAMAEYLIVNDLSAVVDLPTLTLDFHNDLGGECGRVLGIQMGFVELMRRLKATEVAGTGKSVFDFTTMVLHTEFDRSAYLYNEGTNYPLAGSAHWEGYTSMMLAGAGIHANKMIGGYMTSKTAEGSAYRGINLTPHTGLPVDPSTGQIHFGSSSKEMTTAQIFPTLLSIFGCLHLSQLPTMPSALPGVVA